MKAIIRYYDEYEIPYPMMYITSLPVLMLTIHGAPHKRQQREVLQQYREELFDIAKRRISDKVDLPIDHPIALHVLFTNPNSPDLDHTEEALFQALDGKSLEGPSILVDDRHIQVVLKSKIYSTPPTKRDGMR